MGDSRDRGTLNGLGMCDLLFPAVPAMVCFPWTSLRFSGCGFRVSSTFVFVFVFVVGTVLCHVMSHGTFLSDWVSRSGEGFAAPLTSPVIEITVDIYATKGLSFKTQGCTNFVSCQE